MKVATAGGIAAIAALAITRALAQSDPAPVAVPQQDSAWFDPDGTAHITRVVPMPGTISTEAQQWIASLAHNQPGHETLEQRRTRTNVWRATDSAEALKHYP